MIETTEQIRAERKHRAEEIIAQLQICDTEVFSRFPIEIAYLHGSVARYQVLPTSDIDIAVLLIEPLSPYEQLKIELEIQAVLEDATGLKEFDARAINAAPLSVQGEVVQQGFRTPQDSYDAFVVLCEEKIIPFEFLPVLRQMVSFRNRVVSMYWAVSEPVLYPIPRDNLMDFETCLGYIVKYGGN